MPSRTGRTRMQRKVRKARRGQKRKKTLRNKGSTPKFAIHAEKQTAS